MDANTRTLKDVLEGDRLFHIPVYQRPYVWTRDRQWEPLWEDVESTALRLVGGSNDRPRQRSALLQGR